MFRWEPKTTLNRPTCNRWSKSPNTSLSAIRSFFLSLSAVELYLWDHKQSVSAKGQRVRGISRYSFARLGCANNCMDKQKIFQVLNSLHVVWDFSPQIREIIREKADNSHQTTKSRMFHQIDLFIIGFIHLIYEVSELSFLRLQPCRVVVQHFSGRSDSPFSICVVARVAPLFLEWSSLGSMCWCLHWW